MKEKWLCTHRSHCCRRPWGVLCRCRVGMKLWEQNNPFRKTRKKVVSKMMNNCSKSFCQVPPFSPPFSVKHNHPLLNHTWPEALRLTLTDRWVSHLSSLPLHWPKKKSDTHTDSSHQREKKPGVGWRNAAHLIVCLRIKKNPVFDFYCIYLIEWPCANAGGCRSQTWLPDCQCRNR